MREAQCCCGGLKVETTADPQFVVMCHCHECQRRTGAPFGVSAYFAEDDLKITGRSTAYKRSTDTGRSLTGQFCPTCGTTVHWRAELRPDWIGVAVGCFNDSQFPAPQRAVHTISKHEWIAIPEDTLIFDTQPT